MVILTGKNLGERQRDLNRQVAEVINKNIKFDDIKTAEETSDIDKLYKIDIASQYKDVDYIVEVLKSGDSLYISRALKCSWLYHDEYSNIINPENLHHNIFPFMSVRMIKKTLSTISTHIRNSECASNFYIYCKDNEMPNIAFKFLLFTSEDMKLNVLKHDNSMKLSSYIDTEINLQNFIGNSFELATTYIEKSNINRRNDILHMLRYLYAVNNENYLDIVEKYTIVDSMYSRIAIRLNRFGIRISKYIIQNHKDRILRNPSLYVYILNKSTLVKYSSVNEAKIYINSVFPNTVEAFWASNFCSEISYILNLIPINERYEYIKQLFNTKYPGEAFEMTSQFYDLQIYNIMSPDERELWALRHIEEGKEILGHGNDYMWYQFVNLGKAFVDINKYVLITPDRNKRSSIINVLVDAAGDQKGLKKVLDYYYTRHVNENEDNKRDFIDKVLQCYNVFDLNIECWEALNKLFYSLKLYSHTNFSCKAYTAVAVICHILHNIDMPQTLLNFVDLDVNYCFFREFVPKLSIDKSEIVLQYLTKLFVDKLKPFEQDPYNKKLRKQLLKYVNNIFTLYSTFGKDDDKCPDIVKKFMDIHSPKNENETKTIPPKDIYVFIKTDVKQLVDVLDNRPRELHIYNCPIVNKSLRKLKVYFYNDVAQAYISYLDRTLENYEYEINSRLIDFVVFAIFQLGDNCFKQSLMEKYKPVEPKIDHGVIDEKLFQVQQAICRYMSYSRPPVPLENVLQYLKGDYVMYCLPMFQMYAVSLPRPLVIKFTESNLNAPISIQKHGLRLAIEYYSSENLKTLLLDTWKKSKNISLRGLIYKSLFNRITKCQKSQDDARILYDALKFFTTDLHQDDDKSLFQLIFSNKLPNGFRGNYLQVAWNMIIKLPDKPIYVDYQKRILICIESDLRLVQRDFVRKLIEEHVQNVLEKGQTCSDVWTRFTANYIVRYSSADELEENLKLVSFIFKTCLDNWNTNIMFRNFFRDFIKCIQFKSEDTLELQMNSVSIFKHILHELQQALPLKEIYIIIWDLKLTIFIGLGLTAINALDEEKFCSLSHEDISVLCDRIAELIKSFVEDLVRDKQLYPIFFLEIARLLNDKVLKFNKQDLQMQFYQSLTNIGMKETHFLTLLMLPSGEELRNLTDELGMTGKEKFTAILDKIKEFENEEIQSFLYFRFSQEL